MAKAILSPGDWEKDEPMLADNQGNTYPMDAKHRKAFLAIDRFGRDMGDSRGGWWCYDLVKVALRQIADGSIDEQHYTTADWTELKRLNIIK